MFKPAVSKKKIQMLYLQVPRKFIWLSVGNFKIFLKRKKKKGCISLHVLTYMPRVINILLIEKRITNCSLQMKIGDWQLVYQTGVKNKYSVFDFNYNILI